MSPARSGVFWDVPTRVFHWVLAACVVLNLFVVESGGDVHKWTGYVAVSTVLLRFLWGFVGGASSRLRVFFKAHNFIGAFVYVGVWLCIGGLGVSGFMMGLDAYWGEEWLEDIHEKISIGLQVLIGLHLLGVSLDSLRRRRHTWAAMITGRKY